MKHTLSKLALFVVFSVAASAQQNTSKPAPTATPPLDTDVVKITTNLIQIDVTVTDSKARIVADLRPDEIEIYQNGEKQTISNFSFVSSVRSSAPGVKPSDAGGVPPIPTTLRPEQIRRTIALVVDDLSL